MEDRLVEFIDAMSLPEPPRNVLAEQLVVGAIFCKKDMPRLSPGDFTDRFCREVVATANLLARSGNVTLPRVAEAMAAAGLVRSLAATVDTLVEYEKALALEPIEPILSKVTEAARARRMSEWLRKLDRELCLGRVTVSEAKGRLRGAGAITGDGSSTA